MSRYLYVDWENIWIGLRCLGYSPQPSDVIAALVRATFREPHEDVHMIVVTKGGLPPEAERNDAVAAGELIGVDVTFRFPRNKKPEAADKEIAFLVGQRTCDSDADEIAIASVDADLVDVAHLATAACPTMPITLVYVRQSNQQPPESGAYEKVDLINRAGEGLPPQLASNRSASPFDQAAWTLALSMNEMMRNGEIRALHPSDAPQSGKRQYPPPLPVWVGTSKNPMAALRDLEDVDHVLWSVQHRFDDKVPIMAGLDETASMLEARFRDRNQLRLAGNVEQILRALVTADLIRLSPIGDVVHRPTLREGILLPIRRAILIMHCSAKQSVDADYLQRRHVKRRPLPAARHQVTKEQAEASFAYTRHAITKYWGIAVDRNKYWTMKKRHGFVVDTARRAGQVYDVVRTGMLEEDITQALGVDWFSGRWLRLLADAQLLSQDPTTKAWQVGDRRILNRP